jgi:hypothetical protein
VRIDDFVLRLENLRKSGRGWSARCPSHVDRTNSLSVAVGDHGALLVHCFAGCGVAEIVGAMGLHVSDLFPDHRERDRPLRSRKTSSSSLQEAREQILHDARQQPWASQGARLLYVISDWIRLTRRKVAELRQSVTAFCDPDQIGPRDDILLMAAKLETFVNAIEAELDDILATGRID